MKKRNPQSKFYPYSYRVRAQVGQGDIITDPNPQNPTLPGPPSPTPGGNVFVLPPGAVSEPSTGLLVLIGAAVAAAAYFVVKAAR